MAENIPAERPRVVVGVDRSPAARAAIRWAAQYADEVGATLEFIAAWQPLTATFGWRYVSETAEENERFAENGLAAVIDEIFPGGRPAHCKLIIEDSHPANALIAASKGATCVVVGSRGHGGLAGAMLGSVSSAVAAHAACPVVVLHDGD